MRPGALTCIPQIGGPILNSSPSDIGSRFQTNVTSLESIWHFSPSFLVFPSSANNLNCTSLWSLEAAQMHPSKAKTCRKRNVRNRRVEGKASKSCLQIFNSFFYFRKVLSGISSNSGASTHYNHDTALIASQNSHFSCTVDSKKHKTAPNRDH